MTVIVAPEGGTVVVTVPNWDVECGSPAYSLEFETGIVDIGGIPYTGEYVSTPSWETQTYETFGRVMMDDFIVDSIVKLEVDNPSGGLTLTI